MSASLVGSEMCIRDRFLGFNGMSSDKPLSYERLETQLLITGQQPLESVSYTHLTLPTICSV
eukprot:13966385-Alexandrium_andersonii.AAC.1